MKKIIISIYVIILLIPQLVYSKTVGLFIGVNEGLFYEESLYYAHLDALKLWTIFKNFGELENEGILLQNVSKSEIIKSINNLEKFINASQEKDMSCVFYYSGHGGTEGFHIKGEILQYDTFYDKVKNLSCRVKVIVIDACNSGKFLSVKGTNYKKEGFRVGLYDNTKGEVIITSSADNEFAQESDSFRGGIFSHYFSLALEGEADVNKDGYISIQEAYQFAYQNTVAASFFKGSGQYPHYQFRKLEGLQELYLTRIKKLSLSRLIVDLAQKALVTLMDIDKKIIYGPFTTEIEDRTIYLPPSRYYVKMETDNSPIMFGEIKLNPLEVKSIGDITLKPISMSDDPIKGSRITKKMFGNVKGIVFHLLDPDAIFSTIELGSKTRYGIEMGFGFHNFPTKSFSLEFVANYAQANKNYKYGDNKFNVTDYSIIFGPEMVFSMPVIRQIKSYFGLLAGAGMFDRKVTSHQYAASETKWDMILRARFGLDFLLWKHILLLVEFSPFYHTFHSGGGFTAGTGIQIY